MKSVILCLLIVWGLPCSLNAAIDRATYNKTLNLVEDVYGPVIKNRGGQLNVVREWLSSHVNEFVRRGDEVMSSIPPFPDAGEDGPIWTIMVPGGIARHALMTKDAFTLLVCHELGHHLGGAPKKQDHLWGGERWLTSEGQADYFATTKCARRLWGEAFSVARAIQGSLELAQLIGHELKGRSVSLSLKNNNAIVGIEEEHPSPECRLKTMVSGSLCRVSWTESFDNHNPKIGACNQQSHWISGQRPACWYNP